MSAMLARLPPMSGLPVRTTAEPSALTLTVALDCIPALNQKPAATPRPWFSPSSALYCGWARAASSVSLKPIGPNFGPYFARPPSSIAFWSRISIGSRPSFRASSSIRLSAAKEAIGAPGAR